MSVAATLHRSARAYLETAVAALAAAGIDSARPDAEWLLGHVVGVRRLDLYQLLDRPLAEPFARRYERLVRRRARREPLQRLLGYEDFCGLRFSLTDAVMVPRPETESLVIWALERLPARRPSRGPLVIDAGTGSGCIAAAIAHARPDAAVVAVDLSSDAAIAARRNVAALRLDHVGVVVGDLLSAVRRASADVVVANPPYVSTDVIPTLAPEVVTHDPRSALDGGPDGLAVLRPLVAQARTALRPGGWLLLETAGGAQAERVRALMTTAGFVDVTTRSDLAGVARFVGGRAGEAA